jgi:hypothetical protein
MRVEALVGVIPPVVAFIGSAVAYYWGTESGDEDQSPHLLRGEVENEPWGIPYSLKTYRLPGDSVRRSYRDSQHDTRQLLKIIDTEGNACDENRST